MTAAHRRNFTIRKGILTWLIIKVEILTLVSKIMRAAGLKEDWHHLTPMMHFTSVDLPSPFLPTKATLSPRSMVRLAFLNTMWSP